MPLNWGWQLVRDSMTPIMTDEEAGPPDLLKVIRCGCKGECDNNRCACRKSGLKCTSFCKECHGTSCSNTETESSFEDNAPIYDVDLEDRNFMDIFV